MEVQKKNVAISKNGKDYLRIIPFGNENNQTHIKFSFFNNSFLIRKFIKRECSGYPFSNYYWPIDCGVVNHEISYHNSNTNNPNPILLTKPKDLNTQRDPFFEEIIDLDLKNLILPIPICRITVNNESKKNYKKKNEHLNIDLDSEYNTTEIYVSSSKYDYEVLRKRFPVIVGSLFLITTIEYLMNGGIGVEPIINKMLENRTPTKSLEYSNVGNIQIFYKTYKIIKNDNDPFRTYLNNDYTKHNIIEFFNNIEYLDLLATMTVSHKNLKTNKYITKAAYKFDLEHLKKEKFHKDYIKRLQKRFELKENEYKKLLRPGLIFD